jgi:hypothetical protein
MKLLIVVLVILLIAFIGINVTFDTSHGPFVIRSGYVKGES